MRKEAACFRGVNISLNPCVVLLVRLGKSVWRRGAGGTEGGWEKGVRLGLEDEKEEGRREREGRVGIGWIKGGTVFVCLFMFVGRAYVCFSLPMSVCWEESVCVCECAFVCVCVCGCVCVFFLSLCVCVSECLCFSCPPSFLLSPSTFPFCHIPMKEKISLSFVFFSH